MSTGSRPSSGLRPVSVGGRCQPTRVTMWRHPLTRVACRGNQPLHRVSPGPTTGSTRARPRRARPASHAPRPLAETSRRELVSKRTYQPNNRRRHKVHGFRLRMRTRAGRSDPVGPAPQGPQQPGRLTGRQAASVEVEPCCPRVHRVTTGAQFRAAIRSGRRGGTRALVVHLLVPDRAPAIADDTLPAPPTVGFVVSKAVGNAVVRNRVKRRLRHCAAAAARPAAGGLRCSSCGPSRPPRPPRPRRWPPTSTPAWRR